MDAIENLYARNGVLPAEKKPGRKKAAAPAPAPAPLTGPLWMLAKVGDLIRVEGDPDVRDGRHTIHSINEDYLHPGKRSAAIRVKGSFGNVLIYNETVKEILERDGKPFAGTQADIDALLKDRPFWELIQEGDTIRVEGDSEAPDGVHRVVGTDSDLFRGPDENGVNVEGHGYVYNKNVKAIVERDGKPYTGPGAETAAPVPAAKPEAEPLWRQLKVGDKIEVTAAAAGQLAGYYVSREAGVFTVTEVDRRSSVTKDLRVLVKDSSGNETGWVTPERIIRRIEESSTTATEEPAWKRAKIGDKVRVAKGNDHEAGEFEVARIDSHSQLSRLAVKYRSYSHWWISNDKVEAIVGEDAPVVAPIRGNCLIHVDVPTILRNREKAEHRPVVVARRLSKVSEPEIFRELAWDGPSRFVHHEFIRIDGTDIQNWVETDSVLTCWRDGEVIKMLDPMSAEPVVAKPMTKLILGAFVIHIAAPVLMRNRREGRNDPVIAVRQAHSNWASDVVFGRRVEWSGPSRMVHRPSTPIPGTDGRGVSFIETDADVTVYRDDAEPLVLRMPLRAAA